MKSNTRAIRLRRTKKIEDPILYEQKKRDEEERKKEEEERKKRKEEKSKKREEEEECERELERKKKEEVAAALAAAKDKVRKELLGVVRGADFRLRRHISQQSLTKVSGSFRNPQQPTEGAPRHQLNNNIISIAKWAGPEHSSH